MFKVRILGIDKADSLIKTCRSADLGKLDAIRNRSRQYCSARCSRQRRELDREGGRL